MKKRLAFLIIIIYLAFCGTARADDLELQCKSDSPRIWDAIVLACWPQGMAVEIPLLKVKGFVSAAELPQDSSWYFERHAERWTSTDARCLYPGARLRVIPQRVDTATGFADFLPQF